MVILAGTQNPYISIPAKCSKKAKFKKNEREKNSIKLSKKSKKKFKQIISRRIISNRNNTISRRIRKPTVRAIDYAAIVT